MATSLSLFSGFSRSSTVPAGSLAKASSVGAKTVNGPGALQRLDEAGGLDGGDQRLEVAGGDGGVHHVGGEGLGGHGKARNGDGGGGGEVAKALHEEISLCRN